MKNRMLVFSLLILISACATDDITSDQLERQRLLVEIETIKRSSISQVLELSGQLLPKTQVPLVTALPLEINEVHVEIGQAVDQGELLLTLDDEEAQRQLSQAQNAVVQLEKSLTRAKELNRSIENNVGHLQELQQELQESINRSRTIIEHLDQEELENSIVGLLQASLEVLLKQAALAQAASSGSFTPVNTIELEVQIQNAKNTVRQAEDAVQSSKLTSPISGVVTQLNVTVGQTALPNQSLIMISVLSEVDATFSANSHQAAQLSPGLSATLQVAGIAELKKGEISTISPVINPQTNTFSVTVPLNNETMQLKGGMRTMAVIDLDTISEALVVPAKAILYENGEPYVFIALENTVRRQEIELGSRDGDKIEVVKGVKENDQVVTIGKERLTDGAKITIRSE